jgi:hypothetical protein
MSATGAASSTVNLLRLEHPRSATDVYNDTYPNNDSVEIHEPASWLRQLAHQHQLAQADLQRFHQICGGEFDRNDRQIRSIERSYELLFQGIQYVYEQTKADGEISPEWRQTELMAVANASQQFTMQVWQGILTRNEEPAQQPIYQAMQTTRINDALSFLQTADLQRNQEQAIFHRRLTEWANRQQTTTHQLMLEQQRLRNEVDTAQAAIRPVTGQTERRNVPSYLQAAPSASANPTRRTRPPAIPTEDTEPTQENPASDQAQQELPRGEETREEYLTRLIVQTIATTLAANQTANPNAPTDLQAPRVARLKLDNPSKFDGKPKTPFRTWWDSVRDYIRFYPETNGIQRIAWLGTLLTDEAKEWHQARRRLVGDQDTWNAYSEAIQDEYLDPREAATAFNQISALRYKGDIKAYLTAFRALNIHARVTGEALQNKVNLALPLEIIDMRFAQNPHLFTEDEPFLVATYEAGRHWENRNLLVKEKAAIERGSGMGGQNSGTKGSGKGKVVAKEEHQQSVRTNNNGQLGKPGKAKIWKGLRDAFQGVPQEEIDEHKKNPEGCWRCGRSNHSTYQCYARTTAKGTSLPEAPGQVVSATTTAKRELEEDNEETPQHKKTTMVATSDGGDQSEAPSAWAQDTDEEEDF